MRWRRSEWQRDGAGQVHASGAGSIAAGRDVINPQTHVNEIHVHESAADRETYRLVTWPRPEGVIRARERPSLLLAVRYAVVPFDAERRRVQIESMTAWREAVDCGSAEMSVFLLHGSGGQGKTRLAVHVAEESAREGWQVMAAQHGVSARRLAPPGSQPGRGFEVAGDARGLLVVVDYAERWPAVDLLALIEDLVGIGVPVRLLLVARPAGLWWSALAHHLHTTAIPAQTLALPALAVEVADRQAVFVDARDAFAAVLEVPHAEQIPPPAALAGDGFQQVLTVHMAALVAVHERSLSSRAHDAAGDFPPPSDADVHEDPTALAVYLLDRERAHWQQMHAAGILDTRADTMAAATYLATLTGPLSYSDGQQVLTHTGLASTPETARRVLVDHACCYPPSSSAATVLEPLYPDRLGEDFVALQTPLLPGTWHTADGAGREDAGLYGDLDPWTAHGYRADPWADTALTALLAPATSSGGEASGHPADYARSVIRVLIETARRWPHIAQQRLYPLLAAHPHLAVMAGSAALTALAYLDQDTTTDGAAETGIISVLEAVMAVLPAQSDANLDIGVLAVTRRLVGHQLAASCDPAEQAGLHLTLGCRYGFARLYSQAQEHIAQAVALLMPLVKVDPDAHFHTLITAMNNLSITLHHLGQPESALTAITEVVRTRRQCCSDPDTDEHELAVALSNLALSLGNVGRREDALAAITEAVQIRYHLAELHPDKWLPELVAALNNQATCSAELGLWHDSLAASTEAVTISQRLEAQSAGAFVPNLAVSLINQSRAHGAVGQRHGALASITRAVALLRHLASRQPDGYLPDLATSLNALSIDHGELGQFQQALAAISEAVQIRRRLAEQYPDVYLPDLANSLNTFSVWSGQLRQHDESFAAISEAVQIWRRLTIQHSQVHLPHLANGLSNLATNLNELGRGGKALGAISEAVQIRRRIAEQHPDVYLPDLADSLHNLAVHLDHLGQPHHSLAAITEAITIRQHLAALHPTIHEPKLRHDLRIFMDLTRPRLWAPKLWTP